MAKVDKKVSKTINNDSDINPEKQIKKVKLAAIEVLVTARHQEGQKLKEGFGFVRLDSKTLVLRKSS